jgi:hypothetical protein
MYPALLQVQKFVHSPGLVDAVPQPEPGSHG